MIKIILNIFLLPLYITLILPFGAVSDVSARDYIPVDQLGRGSPSSRLPTPKRSAAPSNSSSGASSKQSRSPGRSTLTYVTPSGATKLFGTVEFQRPLSSLPGWLDVLTRNRANPVFVDSKYFNKQTSWADLKASLAGKSQPEQLRAVNSFWNKWKYIEDQANWGKADYWAIPAEFIPRSGDCEDYAISKYFTLKELGFNPEKMRLVVLKDTVRNLAHAVLAVYLNDDVYILDNLSNVVLSHRQLTNYLPQYSINEYGRWAHIRGKS